MLNVLLFAIEKKYNIKRKEVIYMARKSNIYAKGKPLLLPDLSEEEFNREMLKAHNDFEAGRTYSLEEVKRELKNEIS